MLIKNKSEFKSELSERIQIGREIKFQLEGITNYSDVNKIKNNFNSWDYYNSQLLKSSFKDVNNEYLTKYERKYNIPLFNGEEISHLKEMLDSRIDALENILSIVDLLKYSSEQHLSVDKSKIFIVHGKNNELKSEVALFIERQNLEAIILHEQINEGKTIIEKFEHHSNVGHAIILLTADDECLDNENNRHLRSRQNVVFEFGFFIAKLGRKNVSVICEDSIDIPSDLHGLVYINRNDWKLELSRNLASSGYNIELNKIK